MPVRNLQQMRRIKHFGSLFGCCMVICVKPAVASPAAPHAVLIVSLAMRALAVFAFVAVTRYCRFSTANTHAGDS